ncbi:MAG TPA: hypothetical protein DCL54_00485 [Alphaproteobacteria bacterium]|nr:hypothetical protein [Alphaproteobacteria bacterium]HAJ45043.1 hypothetical protein [Alphaproteobacteria bacterium]
MSIAALCRAWLRARRPLAADGHRKGLQIVRFVVLRLPKTTFLCIFCRSRRELGWHPLQNHLKMRVFAGLAGSTSPARRGLEIRPGTAPVWFN